MGTQSSKQTMSRKEQPPSYPLKAGYSFLLWQKTHQLQISSSYNGICSYSYNRRLEDNDVVVTIDKPGVSTEKPPTRELILSTGQPLDITEFLEVKRTFDICRKAEYERAYNKACMDYVRVINYKLRTSLKYSHIFIVININNSCDTSIKISEAYRNAELETQIINKVYDYIVDAYKGYDLDKSSTCNYSIGMRIYLPNNTLPFEPKPTP